MVRWRWRVGTRAMLTPRDYIAYGFRARAQEVAQELLGDLSRGEAERRIWRETQADRFTGFDRRRLAYLNWIEALNAPHPGRVDICRRARGVALALAAPVFAPACDPESVPRINWPA